MKINDLIAALQEQATKHGNVDLHIEVVAKKDQPKAGSNKYYHVFGHWCLAADNDRGVCRYTFDFNKDASAGDWLHLTFTDGRMDG